MSSSSSASRFPVTVTSESFMRRIVGPQSDVIEPCWYPVTVRHMPTFFSDNCGRALHESAARLAYQGAFSCPGSDDGNGNPTTRQLSLPPHRSRHNPTR